jgi:ubiquinone/menaquinone biosynthesis C-methylase UbiE
MNEIVGRILPDAQYNNEFRIGHETYPFFSYGQPDSDAGWSDQMAEQLEQPTKNHFIDRYNREVALDGIKSKLAGQGCLYLDMGCSSGYMLEDVLKDFPSVAATGADYFSAGLLQCHKRLPGVPLFQVDLANCQFSDNLFDAVTCLNVLEHIQQDISALKHLFRIIKPGGILVVTVPMGRNLFDLYDEVHYHVRRYEMKELKNKIISSGFEILKSNYFGVLIYPGFYLTKIVNRRRYRSATAKEKEKIVFKQIKETSRSGLMEFLCNIEYFGGKHLSYPFGIRAYVLAQKPGE